VSAESTAFDAIVVGSGISGGWAAKELCEKGLKTLVLDASAHKVRLPRLPPSPLIAPSIRRRYVRRSIELKTMTAEGGCWRPCAPRIRSP